MTQLIPELIVYKKVTRRFIKHVLGDSKKARELLNECIHDAVCDRELTNMNDTILKLILEGKEVVQ